MGGDEERGSQWAVSYGEGAWTVDGYRANGKGALGKWVGIKKGGANGLRATVRERGQQMGAEPMGKELWVSGWG